MCLIVFHSCEVRLTSTVGDRRLQQEVCLISSPVELLRLINTVIEDRKKLLKISNKINNKYKIKFFFFFFPSNVPINNKRHTFIIHLVKNCFTICLSDTNHRSGVLQTDGLINLFFTFVNVSINNRLGFLQTTF